MTDEEYGISPMEKTTPSNITIDDMGRYEKRIRALEEVLAAVIHPYQQEGSGVCVIRLTRELHDKARAALGMQAG